MMRVYHVTVFQAFCVCVCVFMSKREQVKLKSNNTETRKCLFVCLLTLIECIHSWWFASENGFTYFDQSSRKCVFVSSIVSFFFSSEKINSILLFKLSQKFPISNDRCFYSIYQSPSPQHIRV